VTGWGIEWYVADRDGNILGELNGSGGSITWDGGGRIQRVCRGVTFSYNQWKNVNPFVDWFVPVFRTSNGVGTRLGLFTAASVPFAYQQGGALNVVEPYLVDGGFFLDQPSSVALAGRTNESHSEVLTNFADIGGFTRRTIEPTSQVFSLPIANPPGTSFAAAMSEVTSLAGFLPPHFDRDGVLRLVSPPKLSEKPVKVYDETNILSATRVRNDNLLDAANVIVVLASGGTGSEIFGVAEVPPNAPNSVQNRGGQRVAKVIRMQGISSSSQAEAIAKQIAATSSDDFEQLEFQSVPDPVHDTFGIVEVNGVAYRELSWSMDLSVGGTMSHRLVRSQVEDF
jgi:hypothetical protein